MVMNIELDKPYYSEKEFCDMMEITRKTAFTWRDKRLIGFLRTPTGIIRYRRTDIEEYNRRNGVSPRKVARRD